MLAGLGVLALYLLDPPGQEPAAPPASPAAEPAPSPPAKPASASPAPAPGTALPPVSGSPRPQWKSPPAARITPNEAAAPHASPRLSGRVLDGDGNPLHGIPVRARLERLFEPLTPLDPTEGSAATDAKGQYAIGGLADGLYRITAEAADYARAETTARTGTADADLVLHWEKTLWVFGRLTSQEGRPLAGARVTPNLSPAIAVPTDAEGNYEVSVSLPEAVSGFDIRFEHAEHVPQSRRLDEASWEATGNVELNLVLEPISRTTQVAGRLRSTTGEAVAEETLILYSPSLMRRYEAVSDQDGAFRIPEVAIAPDYLVSVRPRGPYQDHTQRDLPITAPTELAIALVPMESGDLFGRMTDVAGKPVPNFTLMLHSTSAAGRTLAVTGNEGGEFAVADVPFGELVFQTHGLPFFRITNVILGPDPPEVPIVLDVGSHEVRGQVLDEAGFPLAAPEVYLTWSHGRGRVSSTAVRRTAADADGFFRFVGLGAGPHAITVNAPGYRTGRLDHYVGARARPIILQLEPQPLD